MMERCVTPHVVSVGFMPLLDCALLVAVHEKGFAAQQGLRLRLVREVSWANVRDRVTVGHFDAAHMLAPLPRCADSAKNSAARRPKKACGRTTCAACRSWA